MVKNESWSPLVSVIVPVYNAAKFLPETIASISAQTWKNFEIVAVDDGSTDNSWEVLQNITVSEKRLRCFRIPPAGRPAIPRNHGIRESRGKLIAFLDADDLWTPDKLEKQISYLTSHPDVGLLYGASVTFGNVSLFSPLYETLPLPFRAYTTYDELVCKGNTIPCSTVIVKRSILDITGLFDEDPQNGIEDYDLWIQISKVTKIAFYPAIQVRYRVHEGQFSSDWEIKAKRVEYLAAKRNLPLPKYTFARNKGPLILLARNLVEIAAVAYYKLMHIFQ